MSDPIDAREVSFAYMPGRFPQRRWNAYYELPEAGQDIPRNFSACGHTARQAWRNLRRDIRLHFYIEAYVAAKEAGVE